MSRTQTEISQLVILAGGRGTRLGDITADTPKPMLTVAGRPFLEHLLDHGRKLGFTRVVILAGYLADRIKKYFCLRGREGQQIDVFAETEPRGTGSALLEARALLDPAFLMINGDTKFDFDWRQCAAELERQPELIGMLALLQCNEACRYGIVRVKDGKVVGFTEKGATGPGTINGGVYAFRRTVLDRIGHPPVSLEGEVLPQLLAERKLGGAVFEGYFIDIGVPNDLARANRDLGFGGHQRQSSSGF